MKDNKKKQREFKSSLKKSRKEELKAARHEEKIEKTASKTERAQRLKERAIESLGKVVDIIPEVGSLVVNGPVDIIPDVISNVIEAIRGKNLDQGDGDASPEDRVQSESVEVLVNDLEVTKREIEAVLIMETEFEIDDRMDSRSAVDSQIHARESAMNSEKMHELSVWTTKSILRLSMVWILLAIAMLVASYKIIENEMLSEAMKLMTGVIIGKVFAERSQVIGFAVGSSAGSKIKSISKEAESH